MEALQNENAKLMKEIQNLKKNEEVRELHIAKLKEYEEEWDGAMTSLLQQSQKVCKLMDENAKLWSVISKCQTSAYDTDEGDMREIYKDLDKELIELPEKITELRETLEGVPVEDMCHCCRMTFNVSVYGHVLGAPDSPGMIQYRECARLEKEYILKESLKSMGETPAEDLKKLKAKGFVAS